MSKVEIRRKLQQSSKFKDKISHINIPPQVYSIYAKENKQLNSKHLETVRILANRKIKKIGGKINIKIKPTIPLTKKSTGVRMGKGKGPVKEYVYCTKPDELLFELKNIPRELFISVYKKISRKLPLKVKLNR